MKKLVFLLALGAMVFSASVTVASSFEVGQCVVVEKADDGAMGIVVNQLATMSVPGQVPLPPFATLQIGNVKPGFVPVSEHPPTGWRHFY